jgi:hypothetical protein
MALRPDRIHIDSQIDFFMNEVAERGGIVSYSTVGSGAAMDQAEQLCTYSAGMSGVAPIGVLMCDMVNNDLTRMHENWHKEEVQQGGKVTIWSKGTVVTDRVVSPASVTAGAPAYIGPSGYFTLAPGATQTQETGTLLDKYLVGRFQSSADENGFVKVAVNLP